uniref:Relaxin family peptide receptor 2a n=1 Tax=Sphaeramia orbicularis TaxID=375764 RepID=A0A673B7Y8_9TELE
TGQKLSLSLGEEEARCPLGQFPCGNMSECLPQALQCNGRKDCVNGADESHCGDNIGWADLFGLRLVNTRPVDFNSQTECSLAEYPETCDCQQTVVMCVNVDLEDVPLLSSNVTWLLNILSKIMVECIFFPRFLQNNSLQMISKHAFNGLYSLRKLFLSENLITSLSPGVFKDLHQLEWLYITSAPLLLQSYIVSSLPRSMVYTSLQQLPHPSFCRHMPALDWLDLEGNQIKTLNYSILETCSKLEVLNLSSNRIKELPQKTFKINGGFGLKQNGASYLALEGIDIPDIQPKMFLPMKNLSHIYFKKFQYCSYAPHVRSCKPNTDGISSFEDLLANTVLRVSVWVMAFITCFGNLLVIGMRSLIRAENNLHAACIKVLCCADCLMGVYLFFVGVFDVKFRGQYNRNALLWMESIGCRTIGFLAMLSSEVSVLLLTYLTLEKFVVIVFPFSNLRPGKHQTMVFLVSIWLLGFVIAAVPLMNEEVFGNYYGRNGVCFPLHSDRQEKPTSKGYSTGIFLGLNLLAFLVIVFCYSSMFYSIYKTGINAADLKSRLHKDVAVANRFFFIVFSDALCWIPIFLVKVLSLLEVEIPGTISSWVVIFILPINSALNPILYTLTTSFFREQVEVLLCRWQRRSTVKKDRKSLTSFTIFTETSRAPAAYLQHVTLTDADPRYA